MRRETLNLDELVTQLITPWPSERPASSAPWEARHELDTPGGRVAYWTAGCGTPVLFVHGWSGAHGDFDFFIEPLLQRGRRAVALDLPAHGESRQNTATLTQLGEAIAALGLVLGPLEGVVAHSVGGPATGIALAGGLRASAAVLLATPARYELFVRSRADDLGVDANALIAAYAARDIDVASLDLPRTAAALTVPALVVHSSDDRVVDIESGAAVAAAWPGARLLRVEGLGHNRILRDPGVIDAALDFIAVKTTSGRAGVGGERSKRERYEASQLRERTAVKEQERDHVNRERGESDGAPATPTGAVSGELVTETFEYDGGRQVTVYVPPDPPEAIVFAADGQRISKWGRLLAKADVPSTMIVGVHGLTDETLRLHEYSPDFEPERFAAHEQFFVEDVRRWTQSRFGVALPAERTAVFGVSAGGELALALGLRHPQVYGAVFCTSPGGGYKPPGVMPSPLPRTYLVAGTQEPFFLGNARRWADALRDARADVVMNERAGSHGGAFWREEFPLMVAWAFGR